LSSPKLAKRREDHVLLLQAVIVHSVILDPKRKTILANAFGIRSSQSHNHTLHP
jgi:hypothetical protein